MGRGRYRCQELLLRAFALSSSDHQVTNSLVPSLVACHTPSFYYYTSAISSTATHEHATVVAALYRPYHCTPVKVIFHLGADPLRYCTLKARKHTTAACATSPIERRVTLRLLAETTTEVVNCDCHLLLRQRQSIAVARGDRALSAVRNHHHGLPAAAAAATGRATAVHRLYSSANNRPRIASEAAIDRRVSGVDSILTTE